MNLTYTIILFLIALTEQSYALKSKSVSLSYRFTPPKKQLLFSSSKKWELSQVICKTTSKASPLKILWDFSRPHTMIGSTLSICSLFAFAAPISSWKDIEFLRSLTSALISSLAMNLYITGLNQVTDVDIDIINKPYLPVASGDLKFRNAVAIVLTSLAISVVLGYAALWPLQMTLFGSFLLGTLYSMPPFRYYCYFFHIKFCCAIFIYYE